MIHSLSCGNDFAFYLDLSPGYSLMPVVAHRGRWFLCLQPGSPMVRARVGVQFHSTSLLGPSTNTQHSLRLHLIIFILNYNSADMDSSVEYSGSRQSRVALSPQLGLAEVDSCMNSRQFMFSSAVGQNKQCSH